MNNRILEKALAHKIADLKNAAEIIQNRVLSVQQKLNSGEHSRINGLGELQGIPLEFDTACAEISLLLKLIAEGKAGGA